jgi:hypothetical protein
MAHIRHRQHDAEAADAMSQRRSATRTQSDEAPVALKELK